jgi:hypothetical protein
VIARGLKRGPILQDDPEDRLYAVFSNGVDPGRAPTFIRTIEDLEADEASFDD